MTVGECPIDSIHPTAFDFQILSPTVPRLSVCALRLREMFAPVGSDQASSETKTKIAAIKAGIPVRMLPDSSVELLEDQRFHVTNMPGVNISVDVPAGFVCDGASIPRCFWILVGHPLEGGPLRAAITHDWLCSHAKTRSERRFADTIFMWILALEKVPWIRRVMMFIAVRAYATFVWKPGRDE